MKKVIAAVLSIALVSSSVVLGSSTQTSQNLARQNEQGELELWQYKQLEPSYISSFAEYFFQLSPEDQNRLLGCLDDKNESLRSALTADKANLRGESAKDDLISIIASAINDARDYYQANWKKNDQALGEAFANIKQHYKDAYDFAKEEGQDKYKSNFNKSMNVFNFVNSTSFNFPWELMGNKSKGK